MKGRKADSDALWIAIVVLTLLAISFVIYFIAFKGIFSIS